MARKPIDIDVKIERQQEIVAKAKAKYEEAQAELDKLLEKKDSQKKEDLVRAIENSNYTYDQIMEYLLGGVKPEAEDKEETVPEESESNSESNE